MVTTELFNDTYEIQSQIGKGGMSTVYLARHKRLHTSWAMKKVAKNQITRFDFLAEANILKRLQHPMLPRIIDIFEDDEYIYIVEDFVQGITLGAHVSVVQFKCVVVYADQRQILCLQGVVGQGIFAGIERTIKSRFIGFFIDLECLRSFASQPQSQSAAG